MLRILKRKCFFLMPILLTWCGSLLLLKSYNTSVTVTTEEPPSVQSLLINQPEVLKHYYKDHQLGNVANATQTDHEFLKYISTHLINTSFPGVENYIKYQVIRQRLQPIPDAKPLRPEFGPVIHDVFSFEYPINIPPCHDVSSISNRSVFIAVISAPGNFERRQSIRKTWKKHLRLIQKEKKLGVAGFAFIIGMTKDEDVQTLVEQESITYKDIIQISMADYYKNLTTKVIALLNWIYRFCSNADFSLKLDDDIYLNVRNLARFIHQTYHPTKQRIFSRPWHHSLQLTRANDKWYLDYEEWPWATYPSYCVGQTTLMPNATIIPLLAAAQTVPSMPIDDIYLNGMCAKKAGISVYATESMTWWMEEELNSCHVLALVTWFCERAVKMYRSHVMTESFYSNESRCVTAEEFPNKKSMTIDYTREYKFSFVVKDPSSP